MNTQQVEFEDWCAQHGFYVAKRTEDGYDGDVTQARWMVWTAGAAAEIGHSELERLRLCERRLAAVVQWLEANQPDVFRRGFWEAVNSASA